MKPKIIMHTQISLDGRIKGFDNPEVYYQVAGGIHSDAVLFGSNTVFTAFEKYPAETEADFEKIITSPEDPRPIGVIPDSRGILRSLHCLRNLGYLKEIVILVSTATPKEYLNYLEERHYAYIVSGNDHVDYEKAFQILHEQYGCKYMRTDSGGGLTNKLLENGLNLVARFIDVLIVSRVTNYRSVDYSTIKNFVFNVTKDIRMTDIPTLKQKLEQQYINLAFDPAAALSDLRLNSFTKKYIKNILARITGYIEEQTGVASNYCNYMNTQTKNPFEIEHIITDHYEWFTAEYSDQDDFRRWRNSIGALLLLHKSINASLNDAKYDYKLKKYCSNEGNIYTESLGDLAYQNNPKFKKFIADNNLGFKSYTSFGKNEITERIAVLVDLVKLVWNDDMFM